MAVEPRTSRLGRTDACRSKDLFREGIAPDRVFTFRAYDQWGTGMIEKAEKVNPGALAVRLADGREFAMRMEGGVPVVDWTGG